MSESSRRRMGELGLIVVGVFCALVAENAWSARGEGKLVEAYLVDLQADLDRDTLFLRMVPYAARQQTEAARALLGELEGPTATMTPGETAVALFWASRPFQMFLEFPTYADLNASGNLRLIPRPARDGVVMYDMTLTGLDQDLPKHPTPLAGLGLIPGDLVEALIECWRDCGSTRWDPPEADLVEQAEASIADLGKGRRQSIQEWRSSPNVRYHLEATLAESLWFARRWELVQERHGAAQQWVKEAVTR